MDVPDSWPLRAPFPPPIRISGLRCRSLGVAGSPAPPWRLPNRSEEHTSELQSLMRISYAVFCLKKQKKKSYYRKRNRNKLNINIYIYTKPILRTKHENILYT